MQKLAPLTSLRFFASASIVVYHAGVIAKFHPSGSWALGVSFFFVLSGFILSVTYRDFSDRSIARFYVARIARLWPVHILTLLTAIYMVHPWSYKFYYLTYWNAALLHSWIPKQNVVFSYNGVSWSISVELFFYAMFPILARWKNFGRLYLAIAGLTVGYLITATVLFSDPSWSLAGYGQTQAAIQFPVSRLLEFATGVAAGRFFLSGNFTGGVDKRPDFWAAAALVAVALSVLMSIYVHPFSETIPTIWLSQAGCQFAFAFAIFVLAFQKSIIAKVLSNGVLVRLGDISFATYMVHVLVLKGLHKYIAPSVGTPLCLIIAVVLTYTLSYAVWAFVEMPSKNGIMWLFDRATKLFARAVQELELPRIWRRLISGPSPLRPVQSLVPVAESTASRPSIQRR